MLPHELEKVLDRIAWGKRFVRINDGSGNQRLLMLKSLDLRDRNFIAFIYDEMLKEALDSGVLSDSELKKELELRYLWGPPQEEELEKYNDQLKKLREMLVQARDGREKRRTQKAIEITEKKANALRGDKVSKFSPSAEKYAEVWRMYAIIFSMTYTDTEDRLWLTWEDFRNECDIDLIGNIVQEINKQRAATEKEIRKLARSGLWRTLWSVGKSSDLFGKPIIYLDSEQHALVYWSQVYDSVYEAYERPADDIINDDEKLDKWFEDQAKKKKLEKKKKAGEPFGITKNIARHGEVFIVVNKDINPNAPTLEEVSAQNSVSTQGWKNRQFDKIKKHGIIEERDLRPRGDREARGLINSTDAILGRHRKGQNGTTRDVVARHPGGTL
jgi:hypothetical protein